MIKAHKLWWLVVCLLVIGCGKKGQDPAWPAVITSFGNLSEDQKTKVMEYIDKANTAAGKVVIQQDNNSDGYPISLLVANPPKDSPLRAGYTVRTSADCHVEFSTALDAADKLDYWQSVFLHEVVGHCAGQGHVQDPKAVMYPTTAKFNTYDKDELTIFFTASMSLMWH